MQRVAKFEKVSFSQFRTDWQNTFGGLDSDEKIQAIYDNIKLPTRATEESAGYDFFLPCPINLKTQKTVKIPTGIRVRIDVGWCLKCYSRSGLGFKYMLRLSNGTGIIDSDYYSADNQGHMFAKMSNENNENKTVELNTGDAFMQGIFVPFGITVDDNTKTVRTGGLGSTSQSSK